MSTGESCDLLDQLLRAGPGSGHPQPIPGPGSAAVNFASSCVECCCDGHCRFSHRDIHPAMNSVMSVLLARRPVDFGHPEQHHLGLHHVDLDQGAANDDEHVEEKSCDCSIADVMSSLSLNLD